MMEKVLQFDATPEEASEMKADIARMITEMNELREQGQRDQTVVKREQVETRAMLKTIAEVLAELKMA